MVSTSEKDIERNAHRASVSKTTDQDSKNPGLLHPSLNRIPMQVRFCLAGTLSNVIFMVGYNYAIPHLDQYMAASSVYALIYSLFIPISHALMSLVVFGWPQQYIKSLLSNFPIGISAMILGAAGTAYLDQINFELFADDFVRSHITKNSQVETDDVEDLGEFYSSLVIMTVTGLYTYVVSVIVNTPTKEPHKKEL